MASTKNLFEMAGGAFMAQLEYETGRVLQNIVDPSTDAKAKRKITVTFTILPNAERDRFGVSAEIKSAIAPASAVSTIVALGEEDGSLVARELTAEVPGQTNAFDATVAEKPAALRFSAISG